MYLSCSWQTMNMASVVLLPDTKVNCISSMFTNLVDGRIQHSVPAASWLDLCAWGHGSYHGQGPHPCPCWGSGWSSPPSLLGTYHCWKQSLSVFLPARLLPHQQLTASPIWYQKMQYFILLSVLRIWVTDTLGGGPAVGGTSGSSLLGHSNSTLRNLA